MADLSPVQKADYQKFYVKNPKEFSPERNKAVIERTITDYETMLAQKANEKDKAYAERSNAVVSYLRHLDQGKSTPVDRYFGKRTLAYLRGEQIREKLMANLKIVKKGEMNPFLTVNSAGKVISESKS